MRKLKLDAAALASAFSAAFQISPEGYFLPIRGLAHMVFFKRKEGVSK